MDASALVEAIGAHAELADGGYTDIKSTQVNSKNDIGEQKS